MYRNDSLQPEFPDFYLPFAGKLSSSNRWIKLAALIPWELVEELYQSSMSGSSMGAPAKSARIAFGALVVKERLALTDEETVAQIQENPFIQYFLGLSEFRQSAPFDPSLMVHFRARFKPEHLAEINERIVLGEMESAANNEDQPQGMGDNAPSDVPSGSSSEVPCAEPSNEGKLLIDATCTPADIAYPTDLSLLNEAREKAERIIDVLHADLGGTMKKPRDYRRRARKDYLAVAKAKKPGWKKVRHAIGQQLRYLKRDIEHIHRQLGEGARLSALSSMEYKNLLVIQTLYAQQEEMYRKRVHTVADRIVSISQPHVRPIVRGKTTAPVEFGAKVSISCAKGYVYLDKLSWDAYNECNDLPAQVESYKRRHGCYPESVHADAIYRTRANRAYCTERDIRLSGIRPGRLPDVPKELAALRKQAYEDDLARNAVEGKFGNVKRKGTLARVMAKLARTAETTIHLGFIVLNLNRKLVELLRALLFGAGTSAWWCGRMLFGPRLAGNLE